MGMLQTDKTADLHAEEVAPWSQGEAQTGSYRTLRPLTLQWGNIFILTDWLPDTERCQAVLSVCEGMGE